MKATRSSPGLTLLVAVLKLFSKLTILFTWFQKHRGSNPSDKFDIFSDGILYMAPDNPPVSKIRSVSLRFNFSELCSEPRRARGATSTAEISKTLRRNPIIFYKIVEGGHIKESWAGFLNRTNIESDAWEVEIEFLVSMIARGGACFYTFTL